MSRQILVCNIAAGSTTSTQYTSFNSILNTTELTGTGLWAAAGTLRNLRVKTVDPGVGKTVAFTLMKNGSPQSLTVTVSSGQTVRTDIVNSVSIAAGDTWSIKYVPSGTPTVGAITISIEFDSTTTKESSYCSGSTSNVLLTRFFALQSGNEQATEINAHSIIPSAGTITKLYARCTVAPTTNWVAAIYKNTVIQDGTAGTPDTRITMTTTALGSSTFSLTVAAGDELSVGFVPNGGINTLLQCAVNFVSTGAARFFIFGNPATATTSGTTANQFNNTPASRTLNTWDATESNRFSEMGAITPYTIKNMYMGMPVAPGFSGAVMALRKTSASTALSATVGAAATQTSVTANVNVTTGFDWDCLYQAISASTTAKIPRWSFSIDISSGTPNQTGNKGNKNPGAIGGNKQYGPTLCVALSSITSYGAG